MKFFKFIIPIFLIFLLSVATILLMHFKIVKADTPIYEMAGWLWTDNYGWISLNSENSELNDYPLSAPYKVVVKDNQISGWGWSSNLGWVCFGETCDPNNICNLDITGECEVAALAGKFGNISPQGGWKASIDLTSGKISGWAKVLSLKDAGIIRFNSEDSANPEQLGEQCFDCKKKCIEYEQIPNPNNSEEMINGDCIKYSETEFENCKFCFTKTYFGVKGSDGKAYPEGIPESEAVLGGSGNICFNCSLCNLDVSEVNNSLSRTVCSSCSECKLFGSAYDFASGALVGWAWSSDSDNGYTANVGWIQLNTGWAGIVYPWLETQFGSVYSSANIRQRNVVSGKNATYCIFAKDVYNFTSSQCQKNFYNNVDISYLTKSENQIVYKNALGKIDIQGLTTKISSDYNIYGNKVIVNQSSTTWGNSVSLLNQVYVINGNLTINNGFSIKNKGSGLVIVDGDLKINGDFSYESDLSTINNIKDLGSIAWIVKGDVIVDPTVTKMVGAFIILGKDGSPLVKLPDQEQDYPKFDKTQYGIFFSGQSDKPLTIIGLIIAKAFGWERFYSNIKQGSERIIYDGRLIANPPPGLQGFAEGLPIIRDFEF